jgi:hypothetical protein
VLELSEPSEEPENILRWEDDGGQISLDVDNSKDWSNLDMDREQAND